MLKGLSFFLDVAQDLAVSQTGYITRKSNKKRHGT